jgi:anti-sigma B factor antagonist
MKIDITEKDGKKIVAPEGEIDMYSSPALRKALMRLVGDRVPALYVDLGGVSYIDSSGIATFVESLKEMMSYGGRLKLYGVPGAIMEIFRFSRLDAVFEIYGDFEDAVNN